MQGTASWAQQSLQYHFGLDSDVTTYMAQAFFRRKFGTVLGSNLKGHEVQTAQLTDWEFFISTIADQHTSSGLCITCMQPLSTLVQ